MLLLMTFLARCADSEKLREYQRTEWGKSNGETCVIELSGLAANNLTVTRDRESFREERIKIIAERIRVHRPELVVMYGTGQRQSWERIVSFVRAECTKNVKDPSSDDIFQIGPTTLALTPHPTSHGVGNSYWTNLGEELRALVRHSETQM